MYKDRLESKPNYVTFVIILSVLTEYFWQHCYTSRLNRPMTTRVARCGAFEPKWRISIEPIRQNFRFGAGVEWWRMCECVGVVCGGGGGLGRLGLIFG